MPVKYGLDYLSAFFFGYDPNLGGLMQHGRRRATPERERQARRAAGKRQRQARQVNQRASAKARRHRQSKARRVS